MEPGEYPNLGASTNRFVTLVNPCAVKGIAILLELADSMPAVPFAAVPTWGTNAVDTPLCASARTLRYFEPVDHHRRPVAADEGAAGAVSLGGGPDPADHRGSHGAWWWPVIAERRWRAFRKRSWASRILIP